MLDALLIIQEACAWHPGTQPDGVNAPCVFKQGFLPFWRLCFHAAKLNSFFTAEEVPPMPPFLLRAGLNEKTQQ